MYYDICYFVISIETQDTLVFVCAFVIDSFIQKLLLKNNCLKNIAVLNIFLKFIIY